MAEDEDGNQIIGTIRPTDIEGEMRTSYDIWADDVVNLSPREDGGVPRASGATRTHRRSRLPRASRPAARVTGVDDLPVLTACCICL